jgi:iron complex transport system ATP-binding protein
MTDPLLAVEGLQFGPGMVALTGPTTFRLELGAILVVLGPNGVGKTTLFRTLLGLSPAMAGEVTWGGQPLRGLGARELSRHVAYVPQRPGAAFDFTVEQYVMLGRLGRLGPAAAPGRLDRAATADAIERLGLGSLRSRPLSRMSGGERQLASLARALAQQASALILDEPAASLDLGNQVRVLDTLRALAREGLSIVYSTHDPNHALRAGHYALLMTPGGDPRHGSVDAVVEPDALSHAFGTPIEQAHTAAGVRLLAAAGGPRG